MQLHYFPILISIFSIVQIQILGAIKNDQQQQNRRLKVLVFSPSLSWSHMQFLGKIADTLAEAGHEVHFLKLVNNPALIGRNETKLAPIRLLHPQIVPGHKMDFTGNGHDFDAFTGEHYSKSGLKALTHDRTYLKLIEVFTNTCEELVKNRQLYADLFKEHYDVAIAEMYDPCTFALFERVGIKTKLGAIALPLVQSVLKDFGIPTFSSFVPNFSPPINGPNMAFWERAVNFYNDFHDWIFQSNEYSAKETELVKTAFGPEYLPIRKHLSGASLLFANTNPFFDFPRPLSNKIVYIGGLQEPKMQKIDQNIQHILDNSKRGAVLVSFGTIATTDKMPLQMRRNMIAAFARFPEYDFIWKLDSQSCSNESAALMSMVPNVHTFEWMQQSAVLKHPKLVGFITHSGQNSVSEAARAGVPLVTIPLFTDQLYNAVLAKHKGMAVYMDIRKLLNEEGEEMLVQALGQLLHNPTLSANAKQISRKITKFPFSPRENLIRWVEFAAQFPNLNELNLPGERELGWFVYYSVDVILFTAAVFVLVSVAVAMLVARIGFLALKIGQFIVDERTNHSKKIA